MHINFNFAFNPRAFNTPWVLRNSRLMTDVVTPIKTQLFLPRERGFTRRDTNYLH